MTWTRAYPLPKAEAKITFFRKKKKYLLLFMFFIVFFLANYLKTKALARLICLLARGGRKNHKYKPIFKAEFAAVLAVIIA